MKNDSFSDHPQTPNNFIENVSKTLTSAKGSVCIILDMRKINISELKEDLKEIFSEVSFASLIGEESRLNDILNISSSSYCLLSMPDLIYRSEIKEENIFGHHDLALSIEKFKGLLLYGKLDQLKLENILKYSQKNQSKVFLTEPQDSSFDILIEKYKNLIIIGDVCLMPEDSEEIIRKKMNIVQELSSKKDICILTAVITNKKSLHILLEEIKKIKDSGISLKPINS